MVRRAVHLLLAALAVACGGETAPTSSPEPRCAPPPIPPVLPDASTPASGQPFMGKVSIVFENRCDQPIWPAYGHTGGLDSSVPSPDLWAPLSPGQAHEAEVRAPFVGEFAVWGRTGCAFSADGSGRCVTGDCGGFTCTDPALHAPADATSFDFESKSIVPSGYNVGLRAVPLDGDAGAYAAQCVVDCSAAPKFTRDACGGIVACSITCATPGCVCDTAIVSGVDRWQITFCPER